MTNMEPKGDRMMLKFSIPSRGIIGLRNYLLNVTAGEAITTHRFKEYQPYKGEIPGRINGSLIVMEQGEAIPYSLHNLQDRGRFFVDPGESVYEGQVIGEHSRSGDLVVNITRTKKLTNIRASGSDEKMRIAPAIKFSLEEALEYIQSDEYVEVTPKSIRLRKILLSESDRKRERNKVLN
jgi:GTP-binding protein